MTYTQTRTAPAACLAPKASPVTLPTDPGYLTPAERARRENAAMRRVTGANPYGANFVHQGGQSPHRLAWLAELPQGEFSSRDADATWNLPKGSAASRLDSLVACGLLDRTKHGEFPVRYWRAG
jgi:hypothetical protein